VSETPARTSYELFVRRHLSPATLATFPVALMPTAVPRNTVHRLRVGADSDIAEIVGRLTECDVELLEIRRCPQDPPGPARSQPVQWTVPPEEDGSDVVVAFPARPAAEEAPPAPGRHLDDAVSVLPLPARSPADAGDRRARRLRRRAARG
jgi:hypothetical protein